MVKTYHIYSKDGLQINNVPHINGQLDVVTRLNVSAIIKSMKRTCVCKCDYKEASSIANY